jgi:hypothetical protein
LPCAASSYPWSNISAVLSATVVAMTTIVAENGAYD